MSLHWAVMRPTRPSSVPRLAGFTAFGGSESEAAKPPRLPVWGPVMSVLDSTALDDNSLALEHASQCRAEARTDEEATCCMALIDALLDERQLLQTHEAAQ